MPRLTAAKPLPSSAKKTTAGLKTGGRRSSFSCSWAADRSSVERALLTQPLRTVTLRHWITSLLKESPRPSRVCTRPPPSPFPADRRPRLIARFVVATHGIGRRRPLLVYPRVFRGGPD